MKVEISRKERQRPKVWIIQPVISHYRLPVWDEIIALAGDSYELTVLGCLEGGQAFGGGKRDYLRHLDFKRRAYFGQIFVWWPDAVSLFLKEKPSVLAVTANPRNITSWRIPGTCHKYGTAVIGWGKVWGHSKLPSNASSFLNSLFYKRYDAFICYGKKSLNSLVNYDFPERHIYVAQNTIDTDFIFKKSDSISKRASVLRNQYKLSNSKILLCVGKMQPEKRHRDLLTAWHRIRRFIPDVKMVLVGSGPLLEKIKSQAQDLDPQNIIVTGRVPEGDDYAWIAAADFFVAPGAVGLAINQAMAIGTATIIADEDGPDTEILRHGITGWRYPKGDVDRFVELLVSLTTDEQGVKKVTHEAVRLMREEVNIRNMAESIDRAVRFGIEMSTNLKDRT